MKILQRKELGGKKGNKGRKQTFNHQSKLNQINSRFNDGCIFFITETIQFYVFESILCSTSNKEYYLKFFTRLTKHVIVIGRILIFQISC